MIRRPPRSTQSRSSAASDVYKRQVNITVFKRSSDATGSSNIVLADDEIAHVGVVRVINGDMQEEIEPGASYGMSGVITMPKIAAVIG